MQRLELLYEYQKGMVLSSPYLQVDETVIKVLDHQNKKGNGGPGRTHQGYFWAYHDPLGKNTFFKYEPTRAGAYPADMCSKTLRDTCKPTVTADTRLYPKRKILSSWRVGLILVVNLKNH